MVSSPKRRARFKKGVTPPPLATQGKLSWLEEYELKREQRKKREEERLRNRKPLPTADEIRAQFLESTLRYFALANPLFWENSHQRYCHNPSDFMGKLRLGQHLDSYERVIGFCRKVRFPAFKKGRIEAVFDEEGTNRRSEPPKISYTLADMVEWVEAQTELRQHLGMQGHVKTLSSKAQVLVDYASRVGHGATQDIPEESYKKWTHYERSSVVEEAQAVDPRLALVGENHADERVVVMKQPHPLLAIPSLDAVLDLPREANKQDCDAVCHRIEEIVQKEYGEGRLGSNWLILVRTKSRVQAQKSFGYLAPYELDRVCSKLHPIRMKAWWRFPRESLSWIFAVRPEDGSDWSIVVDAIHEAATETSSKEKYGLSPEASALFDWLRRLPKDNFQWGVSPALTDEVLRTAVGLKNPWTGENAFLFFRLLSEEISTKTPYSAIAHPWKEYGTTTARIEFR